MKSTSVIAEGQISPSRWVASEPFQVTEVRRLLNEALDAGKTIDINITNHLQIAQPVDGWQTTEASGDFDITIRIREK